jgi:hypothetical protein
MTMHTHQRLGREAGLRYRLLRKSARGCGLLVGLLLVLAVPGAGHGEEPVIAYTPNPLMTTPFGPASADILLRPANFLPCQGGPIALCYYSGPEPTDTSQPDLSCVVTEDGQFANCRCVEIPAGPYYVDINSILDVELYQKTVKICGKGGVDCREQPNKAPVCQAINDNRLFAREGAKTISTFSYALNSSQGFKITSLSCETSLYAGCMTAPCVRSSDSVEICDDEGESCSSYPVDICACPTFDGPYQVGKAGAVCDIGAGEPGSNVWSAAYNPLQGDTAPRPGCFPDAPGDRGCPLLAATPDSDPPEPVIPAVPADISCGKVCAEYRKNVQAGVQVDFTCDATLCTSTGRDVDLVNEACTGLKDGKIGEILLLETEVGCSCCASQICGCEPDEPSNAEIYMLNQKQRDRNITPQCDINGTLCGAL